MDQLILILTYIVLFVYGLKGFTHEIKELGSEQLSLWLGRFTSNRFRGFLLGAGFTALLQSSSAVTAMAIGLVDTGTITFQNSLGILLGANVGTTVTAWLVTFKLTLIGPYFLLLGMLVSILPFRIHLAGKALFYFGFILFSLGLISDGASSFKDNEGLIYWIAHLQNPYLYVLVGVFLTGLLQSSSVSSGIAILLAYNHVISLEEAIGLIIGSNIGTTFTGLIAAFRMSDNAKRTAYANVFFNAVGVVLFLPLISKLAAFTSTLSIDVAFQVAYAHLIFNLVVGILFLLSLPYWSEKVFPRVG